MEKRKGAAPRDPRRGTEPCTHCGGTGRRVAPAVRRAESAQRMKALRDERRAKGLCADCGGESGEAYRCESCAGVNARDVGAARARAA